PAARRGFCWHPRLSAKCLRPVQPILATQIQNRRFGERSADVPARHRECGADNRWRPHTGSAFEGEGMRRTAVPGGTLALHDFDDACGSGGSNFWTLARTVLSVCTRLAICT